MVKIIAYDNANPKGVVTDFVEDHRGQIVIPNANEYDKLILVIACTHRAALEISGYSVILERPTYLDVVLDIDRSGSMGWDNKMAEAKAAAKTFVDLLEPASGWWIFRTDRDKVGLVSFATSASLDLSLTSDFGRAKQVIDGYSAYGNTNMGDALLKSIQEIEDHGRDETIHSIIFFTALLFAGHFPVVSIFSSIYVMTSRVQ